LIQLDIGKFDSDGKWIVTKKEEVEIRDIFNHMIFTRVSRNDNPKTKNPVNNDIEDCEKIKLSKKS